MENTKIAWAHHSWSPWIGCQAVSPGCSRCYARELTKRFGGDFSQRRLTSVNNWKQPPRWNARIQRQLNAWYAFKDCNHPITDTLLVATGFTKPDPERVFPSMCDWLDENVPIEWLADLLKLIHDTPNLNWLLLTKRIENWSSLIRGCTARGFSCRNIADVWLDGTPPNNVWMGVTAENQEMWDKRVPVLLSIPAKVRFASVEPMLEQIDMRLAAFRGLATEARPCGGREVTGNPTVFRYGPIPDWVIFGAESGPKARTCDVQWIADGACQCRRAGVACYVKQDSGKLPGLQGRIQDKLWSVKEFPKL